MKIVYLVHQFYPEHYTGTEKFILNIAKMSQKNQMKVKVISYSFRPVEEFDNQFGDIVYREYVYQGIPVIAFRQRELPAGIHCDINNYQIDTFCEHVLRQERPDLIHAGHVMRVGGFTEAAVRLNIPYIITLTDFFVMCPKCILLRSNGDLCDSPQGGNACAKHCGDMPYQEKRDAKAVKMLTHALGVYAPSQFVASMINNEYPEANVQVLNHGMSYSKIMENEKVYKSDDHITFFYGGSLSQHKGVHLIVNALTRIHSDNVALKIYGSGHDSSFMDKLSKSVRDDPRIQFCGVYTENDIKDIYRAVDVAIVPSIWYENYPLVLHEALASNVPLIVSNVGGMAEKITDGHNGFTFEIGNSIDLQKKMELIIENPSILNDLKKNIKEFMIPTVEQEAYSYERIYKSFV